MIKTFLKQLSWTWRKKLFYKLLLLLVGSLVEIFAIGSVLPFLSVIMNPAAIQNYPIISDILHIIGIVSDDTKILSIALIFCSLALLAGITRIYILYTIQKTSFELGADISGQVFLSVLTKDYETHLSRNSGDIINTITTKVSEIIFYIIAPMLTLANSLIVSLVIIIGIIFIVPLGAVVGLGLCGFLYLIINKKNRNQLYNLSKEAANASTNEVKIVQETLGSIRDIIIDNSQNKRHNDFIRNTKILRSSQRRIAFLGQAPRYFIEALGMVTIAALAFFYSTPENRDSIIPVLAALALGMQRLLPNLQQTYQSYTTIKGAEASFYDVLKIWDDKRSTLGNNPIVENLRFENELTLNAISFNYGEDGNSVIKDLTISIRKGSKIGIIGQTGSGKSTLIDMIMGLIEPKSGNISVDSIIINNENLSSWQAKIAHVPQNLYLKDGSITENIAFGVPTKDIDQSRVIEAAEIAQISETISKLPKKFDTQIGENGLQISGGQRQRLGIARALYKRAEVLILDEATSALDNSTEKALMMQLNKLSSNLTIIKIAHRLHTLESCELIIDLDSKVDNQNYVILSKEEFFTLNPREND
jgi:ATP-binding cassette, subfamily B, bacterial PglK